MTTRRAAAFLFALFVAAACRPQATSLSGVSPKGAKPKARIHALFTGGGWHRQLQAEFSVDRDAYVMVGHVGGDGRVRVLFPSNASEPGFIRAGEAHEIPSFSADYDAAPSLYSLGRPPMRSVGAQMDSYDGGGHAFIFMISSREPLDFQSISDAGLWQPFELAGYWYDNDPRYQIKEFADEVSAGAPYSLDFAHSFSTVRFSSLSPASYDCAMLASFAISSSAWIWPPAGSWMFANYPNAYPYYDDMTALSGCNRQRYAFYEPVYFIVHQRPLATLRPRRLQFVPGIPHDPTFDPAVYRRRSIDPTVGQAGHSFDAPTGDYTTRRSGGWGGATTSHTSSHTPRASAPSASAPRAAAPSQRTQSSGRKQ